MAKGFIRIGGAREHNLKNLTLDIPRDRLVVITGLSGSGKSSLAFDTIYAEGQRKYVESLSAYARQFLDQMQKPDVDYIEGLSPAIAIEQRSSGMNPRSTVATTTEIYDYLRLLYAHVGQALTGAGYALVGFDLRGHGRSSGARGHFPSLDAVLADINAFREFVTARYPNVPLFLYGHSLGGLLSLTYALQNPSAGFKGVIATGAALRSALQEQKAKVDRVKELGKRLLGAVLGVRADIRANETRPARRAPSDVLLGVPNVPILSNLAGLGRFMVSTTMLQGVAEGLQALTMGRVNRWALGIETQIASVPPWGANTVTQVRLADCWRNGDEEHLAPGKGNLNFGKMFKLIEGAGFKGHYTNAFVSLDAMLAAREFFVKKAKAAGVKV